MNLTNLANFMWALVIFVFLVIFMSVIGPIETSRDDERNSTHIIPVDKSDSGITSPEVTESPVPPEIMEAATTPRETTEPTEPSTEPETEPTEPSQIYFDVPLSKDLQDHIFTLCEQYNVDPIIVIAMIERESTYKANAIGDDGNAFGLMQIQPRWHQDRMDELGVTDLLDPYQNVEVGIDFLAELYELSGSYEWALTAYNGGMAYANKKSAAGELSYYARAVLSLAEELRCN